MKFSPYSYSKISTFESCKKKFDYTYITKIKLKPKYNEALLKGGAVHSILEDYPEASSHKLAEKYYPSVKTWIESPRGQSILTVPSQNEISFGLNSRLEPVEYKDKTAMFRGFIDRIFVKDSKIVIMDYKTGKYREPQYQTYDQLMFYAVWFFQKFPEVLEIKIIYEYVEHLESNELDLHRDNLGNYKMQLVKLIHSIETCEDFSKNLTKLCDYCDYQELCKPDLSPAII